MAVMHGLSFIEIRVQGSNLPLDFPCFIDIHIFHHFRWFVVYVLCLLINVRYTPNEKCLKNGSIMCSVSQLILPPTGEITACERNGHLVNVDDPSLLDSYLEGQVSTFPPILITSESLRRTPAVSGESAKNAFLEHKETVGQRVKEAWYSMGFSGVLSEMCSEEFSEIGHPFLQNICRYLLIGLRWVKGMNFALFPHLKLSQDELISEFSSNRDWSSSPIRFLSWHPKASKFAIALRDDTIKVHYTTNPLVPILKHKLQKCITCMDWKPFSASILAVGTQASILIWNVDPSSFSTRPSAGAAQVLTYSGHSPVTSLAWNPTGDDILVAASAVNSAIVVWNTSMAEYQVIQHVTTCGGVSRVFWSPEGSKVLIATPSSSYRIFETGMWTNERWSNLSGRVQCACWSPRGTILLFALVNDSHIYSVPFQDVQKLEASSASGAGHASVVLDLKPSSITSDSSDSSYEEEADSTQRNCVHSMVWDETGQRIAVMFHKDDPRHHLIALFSSAEDSVFTISPKGYIQGQDDVDPVFITFKPNFDRGVCLTVCWSNGSVTYVPMYIPKATTLSHDFKFKKTKAYGNLNTTATTTLGFDRSGLWSATADESVFASLTTLN